MHLRLFVWIWCGREGTDQPAVRVRAREASGRNFQLLECRGAKMYSESHLAEPYIEKL